MHRFFFLDDGEKTRLVGYLWRAAEFSGITLIAFCIMTNHFHVVAYVPDREEIGVASRSFAGRSGSAPYPNAL